MKDPTPRQREILEVAVKVEHVTGKPCTFYQLARKLDISPVGVRHHVEALRRKGWLESARSPLVRKHPEG
jgi:predicted ArsR family transcriptional regulator